MLRVTLKRKEPECLITLEVECFCVSELNPDVEALYDSADTDLVLSKDSHGRVMIEVNPCWSITVDEV